MPKLKKKKRRTSRLETVVKEKEPEPQIQSPSQKSSYEKSYEEFLNDLFSKTEQTTVSLRDWLNWQYLQTHGAISKLVIRKKRKLDWEFAQDWWTKYARMLGVQGTTDTDGSLREYERPIETARGYIDERKARQAITPRQTTKQDKEETRPSDIYWKFLTGQTTRSRTEEIRDIIPAPNVGEELTDFFEGRASYRPPERPLTKLERLFGKEPTETIKDRFPSERETCTEIENSLRRLGIQTTLCDRGVRRLVGKT